MTRVESKMRPAILRFECHMRHHEVSLCAAVRDSAKGARRVLDLRCDVVEGLHSRLKDIHELYVEECQAPKEVAPPRLVDVPATLDAITSPVKVTAKIRDVNEYTKRRTEWPQKCTHEEEKQTR